LPGPDSTCPGLSDVPAPDEHWQLDMFLARCAPQVPAKASYGTVTPRNGEDEVEAVHESVSVKQGTLFHLKVWKGVERSQTTVADCLEKGP